MTEEVQEAMFTQGIDVVYDGKKNDLWVSGKCSEYGIGEMMCELARFKIREIKRILLKVPGFAEIPNKIRMLESVVWLRDELRKIYPQIISEMVYLEFVYCITDYYCDDTGEVMKECIMNLDATYQLESFVCPNVDPDMEEFIFLDSGYVEPGSETVGQLLLTMALEINLAYEITMRVFNIAISDVGEGKIQNKTDIIASLLKKYAHLQEINYRVLYYGGLFNSVFTIKTMMALCLFELAHTYEKNVPIVKCKNCGHWFVPLRRSDTRYCNYPAPDNPKKTCKEIGAQNTWANKERTDDVTREYRKIYMRYKMTVTRHPDNKEAQEKLEQLTEGIKMWRRRLATGEAEKEDVLRWLEDF